MARTKKIKPVFTEITLDQLCGRLNVDVELSDDDIEEMQLKIEELETKVSDLKDDVENERERADNAYDESEYLRKDNAEWESKYDDLEYEIRQLKSKRKKPSKIDNSKRVDVVGNVIKMWG